MSRLSVGYRKYFPAPRIYRASARKYLKIPSTLAAKTATIENRAVGRGVWVDMEGRHLDLGYFSHLN